MRRQFKTALIPRVIPARAHPPDMGSVNGNGVHSRLRSLQCSSGSTNVPITFGNESGFFFNYIKPWN